MGGDHSEKVGLSRRMGDGGILSIKTENTAMDSKLLWGRDDKKFSF